MRAVTAAPVGLIAASCEAGGLHVMAHHLLLEVVDDEGCPVATGQRGRLVVTDLYNRAVPILRQVLPRRGRLLARSCACGRGLPLVELD